MRAEAEDEHPYSLTTKVERSQKGSRGISLEEFLVCESWIAWEQELRWAHHEQSKAMAYLSWHSHRDMSWPNGLTEEEQTRYEIWKTHFVNWPPYLRRDDGKWADLDLGSKGQGCR